MKARNALALMKAKRQAFADRAVTLLTIFNSGHLTERRKYRAGFVFRDHGTTLNRML
jgi:hypothetical protein